MVVVLALGQPSRQFAFIVIEDIGQTAYAMGRSPGFQPFAFQFFPDHVADGLGPVQIAFSGHELVKLGKQFVVERYGDSFHLPRHPSVPAMVAIVVSLKQKKTKEGKMRLDAYDVFMICNTR